MKLSLCLLTLNEINGCKHDIPLIKKVKKHFYEVFAVDNGSTDGTIEYLRKQGITVIYKPGISYNKMHIVAIKKTKADAIIFFPPKGTNSITDSLKFKRYFDKGYDLIVTSRVIKGSKNEEDGQSFKPRKWLTMILGLVSAIRWRREGNIIWDVLHVFRGIRISKFNTSMIDIKGKTYDLEDIIQSYKQKTKRIEIPTWEKPRTSGESHFKTIPFGIKIFKYFFHEAIKFN